jgi:hypothetical protein
LEICKGTALVIDREDIRRQRIRRKLCIYGVTVY